MLLTQPSRSAQAPPLQGYEEGLGWGKNDRRRTGLAGRCSCRPSGVWLAVVVGMLTWTTSNSSNGGRYTLVFGRVPDSGVPSSTSGRPWLYVSDSHSTGVSLRAHEGPGLRCCSCCEAVASAHDKRITASPAVLAGARIWRAPAELPRAHAAPGSGTSAATQAVMADPGSPGLP